MFFVTRLPHTHARRHEQVAVHANIQLGTCGVVSENITTETDDKTSQRQPRLMTMQHPLFHNAPSPSFRSDCASQMAIACDLKLSEVEEYWQVHVTPETLIDRDG